MKTQCPHCKNILAVPDIYKEKSVKCKKCEGKFIALKFKKPPIVVPDFVPHRQNFITKIWAKSPLAFRTSFLATLGVLSALLFAYYFMEKLGEISFFSPYQAKRVQVKPSIQRESQVWADTETKLTPENVCYLIQLFCHAREFETIQKVSRTLGKNAVKNSTTTTIKQTSETFAVMADYLENIAKELNRLNLPRNSQIVDPSFEQVRNAYLDAIYAEIDIIDRLIYGLEAGKFESDWPQILNRTVELEDKASMQLILLMVKIDINMAKIFSESKK